MVKFLNRGVVLAITLACTSLMAQNKATQTGNIYYQRMQAATLAEGDPDGIVFTVSGVVRDADGKPVADAIVVLRESSAYRIGSKIRPSPVGTYLDDWQVDDVFARTKTDASGQYAFKDIAAPTVADTYQKYWNWSVAASNPDGDFGWQKLKTGYEQPEKCEFSSDVELNRSQPISGTIVSVEGKPVAGADVTLGSLRHKDVDVRRRSPGDFDGNASALRLLFTTGTDGKFVFPKVPADRSVTVLTRHADYQFRTTQVISGAAQVIQAVPRVYVRGRIVDETGAPIVGARLTPKSGVIYAVTDEDGRFALPSTQESLMRFSNSKSPTEAKTGVIASVPDSGLARRGIELSVAELLEGKETTIVLKRGCQLSGKVVSGKDGSPVAGVRVAVNPVGAKDTLNMTLNRTDSQGVFTVVVPREKMAIGISGPVAGYELPRVGWPSSLENESDLVRHVDLTGKASFTLDDFRVGQTFPIQVIVVDQADQPVANATVTAFYQKRQGTNRLSIDRELAAGVKTDVKGSGSLLPTVRSWDMANIRVRATIDGILWYGFHPLLSTTDKNETYGPVRIQLQRGWKLSGRVMIDGKPSGGRTVTLTRRIENGLNSMSTITTKYIERTTTDRNGSYTFFAAPNEAYSVSVTEPNSTRRVSRSQSLEKIADFEYRFSDAILKGPDALGMPQGKIRGVVVDFDGNPIANAHVSCYSPRVGTPGTTAEDGQFELNGLPDRQVRLLVYANDGDKNKSQISSFVNATVGDDDLTIRLDRRLLRGLPRLESKQVVPLAPNEFPSDTGEALIAGTVLDLDDKPIAGAVVRLSAAKRRPVGDEIAAKIRSTSSHPECGKFVTTDANGHFQIAKVSANLLYDVAIGATGYLGNVVREVDPQQPPRNVSLSQLKSAGPEKTVSARVVDADGNGIPGATVEVSPVIYMNGRVRNPDSDITGANVTDAKGNFTLRVATPIRRMTLKIGAGGFAPVANHSAMPGKPLRDIKLPLGSSLTGRLVVNGQPASGVKMELVQADRSIGNVVTPMPLMTDAEGRFRWNHLYPSTEFAIYSLIDQDDRATLPTTMVVTPETGRLLDLGDVTARKGHRVVLRFITEDRKPIPPKSYCYLSRSKAWTSGRQSLPEKFASTVRLSAVPTEVVAIMVRVPGYEVVNVEPECQVDMNRRYAVYCDEDKSFTFTLKTASGAYGN